MKKYICSICGYVYDEAIGDPEKGIAPGTKWEDVPENWACPLCGATKSEFEEKQSALQPVKQEVTTVDHDMEIMRELSVGELSALCSNLSKGCEKQYRTEEAELFEQLSQYYKSKVSTAGESQLEDIVALIQQDLDSGYSHANRVAAKDADRGALRALVWGEKVTKILNSLINRYEKQGDTLLKDTHVYVCEICGFIYIGDEVPEVCPVCKVPNKKIIEVKRG